MEKSNLLTSRRVLLAIALNSVAFLAVQGRETSLVKTKLEEGTMQLGLALKYIGETPYPYAQGNDKSTKIIEPAADTSKDLFEGLVKDDQIYNVKLIREELNNIINSLNPSLIGTINPVAAMWLNEATKSITMANMWLGKELGRIHDTDEYKKIEVEELGSQTQNGEKPDSASKDTEDNLSKESSENDEIAKDVKSADVSESKDVVPADGVSEVKEIETNKGVDKDPVVDTAEKKEDEVPKKGTKSNK